MTGNENNGKPTLLIGTVQTEMWRKKAEQLEAVMRAGWSWGQYQWALEHSDEAVWPEGAAPVRSVLRGPGDEITGIGFGATS